jgi:hypothetical protein
LYPDPNGNPGVSNPSVARWFNPTAFANPAPGTFGEVGRNTLLGPGYSNVNMSLAKEFRLPWEGMRLEFRADAYNLFNHTNYHNPDADVAQSTSLCPVGTPDAGLGLVDCNAGKLTDSAGFVSTLRVLQLGVHFRF